RQGATVDQGMIVSLFPVNAIWVNSYSLTTFADNFLSSNIDPNTNSSINLAHYQAYTTYVVKEHAKWQKMAFSGKNDSNWSATNSSPAIKDFNTWLRDNQTGITTTLSIGVNKTKQLISRGIYVDIMSPSYLENEVFRNGATEPDLAKIPFQDVNMTLLMYRTLSGKRINNTV
ncbi:hypothetical protein ACV1C6_22095, partial [Aeromonas sanarellii]